MLFLCSLDFQFEKIFISTGRAEMNLRFLLGEGKWTQMSGGKWLFVSSKLTDFLLNLQFQPNEVLCCYLSVYFLEGVW